MLMILQFLHEMLKKVYFYTFSRDRASGLLGRRRSYCAMHEIMLLLSGICRELSGLKYVTPPMCEDVAIEVEKGSKVLGKG